MLWLTLKTSNASSTIGPADSIELRGGEIFLSGHAEAVARYRSGNWVHMGQRFAEVECRAVIWIEFEDGAGRIGPRVGPRPVFRVRSRYAFAGRERVASLSVPVGNWIRAGANDTWPVVRLLEQPAQKCQPRGAPAAPRSNRG
jgi:hypothetical protein